ncbi:MAG: methyltransferase domain-containing protein [Carboxydocellales bacterium]
MGHKFNAANRSKLDSPARRKLLPTDTTIAKLGIIPGSVVVDIGCGTGYFSFSLAKAVGAAGQVIGVDISAEMLDEARKRLQQEEEQGAPNNVRFLLSQENTLPMENQSIDVVFMSNVLHELIEPEVFFREIERVLRKEGKVIIVEWKKQTMEMGPPMQERLSPEQVTSLFAAGGFVTQEILDLGEAHYGMIGQRQ